MDTGPINGPDWAPSPTDTFHAAQGYTRDGIKVVPIQPGEKGPRFRDWQKIRLSETDLPGQFGMVAMNIGLLLGEPSGGLTDIDLDCKEAVALAPEFLPATAMISGRASKPKSHYFFTCPGAESRKFPDANGKMLVEIRSTGSQTIVPPSVHPSDEVIFWHSYGIASDVAFADLVKAVCALAIASLLARHWPAKGARQPVPLAAGGFLLRAGLAVELVKKIIGCAARAAGDEEADKRVTAVANTAEDIKDGNKTTGGPSLAKLLGEDVVNAIGRILRIQSDDSGESTPSEKTQSNQLLALVKDIELFVTPDRKVFATVSVKDHFETWSIDSENLKHYLTTRYYKRYGKVLNAHTLTDCLGLVKARAYDDGVVKQVHLRIAEEGGAIFIDMGDESWRAIAITADGWQIVEVPPVKFRRADGMLALPEPVAGGQLIELRRFLNAQDETTWILLVSWLLACFRARGPYPILAIYGEQGSAKTTTARVLRRLIDPNKAELRTQPRDERDLAIAANNQHLVAFDNLSAISQWLSDALCRMATGGALATRMLYSNDQEMLFEYQRPCQLNGIEELVLRSDLLDRTIMITLAAIPPESRQLENEFWPALVEATPRILGALLDIVAKALKLLPTVTLKAPPRMADFALWGTAAEQAVDWPPGSFLRAYNANQDEGHRLALEASPVAKAVREHLQRVNGRWQGTATELLLHLNHTADPNSKMRDWPKDARSLSGALKRLVPNFRAAGIDIHYSKANRERVIMLRYIGGKGGT